jgi:hypothetical protein
VRLVELIAWFLEMQDPPPERVHAREVWHDETGGSLLHAPAWSGEMRDLIEGSAFGVRTIDGTLWQVTFRRPMHATLARIARDRVPDGLPPYDVTLRQLALAQGSIARTADVLAARWPRMGSPLIAARHVAEALRRAHRVFSYEPRGRIVTRRVERSESQNIAEAAPREQSQ